MRRSICAFFIAFLVLPLALHAQTLRLTGRVTGPDGEPLVGVRVFEKGTLNQTLTDAEGRYVLRYGSADAVVGFSLFGYREEERNPAGAATLDVALPVGIAITGLEVVGTRRLARTSVNTPVAVDIIDIGTLASTSGRLDLNQLLQQVAPSFNVNRQSGADGSDHVDPATLRGLGPDQTLVLVNGKRRHQSSLINIFGTRGRGNTGTDLNAIPITAIERIEILRDGASAQYGSDAIAGVINIVLKSSVDELSLEVAGGAHQATVPSKFNVLSNGTTDGREVQLGGNYGFRLKDNGFINASAEFLTRGRTNRPADPDVYSIYRRQFGDAETRDLGFFINSLLPLGEATALYGFGGGSLRDTDAYAWTRDPDSERNVPEIYPNGFDPHILSDVSDLSFSLGVRSKLSGWNVDLNNTYGYNRFHYSLEGTLNASLLAASPTQFDAGGFDLAQNTTSLGFTRLFPGLAQGLNVATGAEFRVDRYGIFAGEEGSYRNYGVRDTVINGVPQQIDVLGRPAGSQGFPGFQPANELKETRTNVGAYLDLELDATDRLLLAAAARFENYSDFGSTMDAKLAGRFGLSDAVSLRASVSTGFRAPSLAQIYFNSTFTDVVAGTVLDKLIARSDGELARTLGLPPLDEETATNASVGFTARSGGLTLTVDGYHVRVRDRIVLTGSFEDTDPDIGADLQALRVSAVQFFANALDTRTVGADAVVTFAHQVRDHQLRWSLAANVNDMELGDIHTTGKLAGKEDVYFGARERHFLLASAPASKATLALDHAFGRFESNLRVTRFGRVELVDWGDTPDVYEAKATTDLTLSYRLSDNARVTLGGANIFNVYPTEQDTETETGGTWDAVQMGFSGAFWFAKLSVRR